MSSNVLAVPRAVRRGLDAAPIDVEQTSDIAGCVEKIVSTHLSVSRLKLSGRKSTTLDAADVAHRGDSRDLETAQRRRHVVDTPKMDVVVEIALGLHFREALHLADFTRQRVRIVFRPRVDEGASFRKAQARPA